MPYDVNKCSLAKKNIANELKASLNLSVMDSLIAAETERLEKFSKGYDDLLSKINDGLAMDKTALFNKAMEDATTTFNDALENSIGSLNKSIDGISAIKDKVMNSIQEPNLGALTVIRDAKAEDTKSKYNYSDCCEV